MRSSSEGLSGDLIRALRKVKADNAERVDEQDEYERDGDHLAGRGWQRAEKTAGDHQHGGADKRAAHCTR